MCRAILRTLPPSEFAEYVERHDDGMWQAMQGFMGGFTGTEEQKLTARQLTTLPMRMGGFGLRCARRMAPAASLVFVGRCVSRGPRETNCAQFLLDWTGKGSSAAQFNLDTLEAWGRPLPADCSEFGEWAHGYTYRVPLQEDNSVAPVMPKSPGPFAVLFRRRMFRCVAWLPDERRIRRGAGTLPSFGLGKIKVACRGGCRL